MVHWASTVTLLIVPIQLQSYPSLSKEKICQVKCGANHVLALTTDGHVLTWRFGTHGELRRKEQQHHTSSLKPERPSLGNIVTIGAGSHQSFAVDSSSLVYGWGLNHMYQLGLGTKRIGPDTSIFVPTLIDSLHPSLHGGARVIAIDGGSVC
ncbi:regulator of chromosome condensation 1/beta-lactamase-inhibitor protein II [Armillaria mellea]|nr:regulator of chromosome condensation 1/beta-lactamase-inhibitor protein II [Armillaria mellea]